MSNALLICGSNDGRVIALFKLTLLRFQDAYRCKTIPIGVDLEVAILACRKEVHASLQHKDVIKNLVVQNGRLRHLGNWCSDLPIAEAPVNGQVVLRSGSGGSDPGR